MEFGTKVFYVAFGTFGRYREKCRNTKQKIIIRWLWYEKAGCFCRCRSGSARAAPHRVRIRSGSAARILGGFQCARCRRSGCAFCNLPEQLCASGSAPGFLYQIPGAALRGIVSGDPRPVPDQLGTVAGDLRRDQSAGLSGSVLLPSVCCRFCKNLSSWLSEILTRPTR